MPFSSIGGRVSEPAAITLRYQSLTKNKGKTSSEVEPDTQTLLLITDADVQAPLLSNDDLAKSEDDVFEPVSEEHRSPIPHKEQPESSHAKDTYAYDSESSSCSETFRPYDNFVPITERVFVQNLQHISEVLYAQVIEDNWTKHEEDSASYADLKASIEEYYKENVDHKAQTDKLVYEIMSNLDKISKAGVDVRAKLMKSLNKVSETLKSDSALKEEMKKMAESNTTISGNITNLTGLLRNAKLPEVITKLDAFKSTLNTLSTQLAKIANILKAINLPSFHQRITIIESSQVTMQADISSIKEMVTEMLQAFKGMSSFTPLSSASISIATQPKVHASIGGENLEKQVIIWKKHPSYTEGEPMQIVPATKKLEEVETEKAEEEPARQPKSPPVAPKADKGKGIATDETEEPTKKLVPAAREVRQDPDEQIRVPYQIHKKIYQLTNDEIQAHLDKEKMLKKAAKEARLLAISKPELIKVVHKEALNIGIDPKVLASAKGG
ncbi:hypothetical protein Tco_0648870 [Tanacetum coccineum]